MLYLCVFFGGVLIGFAFLAAVTMGKHEEMLKVIRDTYIHNDAKYCRDYLREQR